MSVLPSYRNHSIDLHRKSVDWFLYEATLAFNGLTNNCLLETNMTITIERRVQNIVKHLRWIILRKQLTVSGCTFVERSTLDAWLGSEYTFVTK